MRYILLLGPPDDSMLKELGKKLRSIGDACIINYTIEDLIYKLDVNDYIDRKGRVSLSWMLGEHNLNCQNVVGIFNRIGNLSVSDFSDYHEDDRVYALAEYRAYFQFSLDCFCNVINPPFSGSLNGYTRSLVYQWELVKKSFHFSVPYYYFGLFKYIPAKLVCLPHLIVNENPYSVKYWIESNNLSDHGDAKLYYQRPRGSAVLVICIDHYIFGYNIASGTCLQVGKDISSLAAELKDHFKLRIMTMLIFIDFGAGVWSFGSVSPDIPINDLSLELKDQVTCRIAEALYGRVTV